MNVFIAVLAQSEVAKNDETNLKEVEESEADIVKTSNEITLMVAGYENQFAELKVGERSSSQIGAIGFIRDYF